MHRPLPALTTYELTVHNLVAQPDLATSDLVSGLVDAAQKGASADCSTSSMAPTSPISTTPDWVRCATCSTVSRTRSTPAPLPLLSQSDEAG
jgi:hypothetical protein